MTAAPRICAWCRGPIPDDARVDAVTCGQRCRQARWKFTRDAPVLERARAAMRLAYADPPYVGKAYLYADHPDYDGEVDHRSLLAHLAAYDGWALSCSATSLPMLIGICLELALDVRVAAWFRGGCSVRSRYPVSAWEPVIFAGGRQVARDERVLDALVLGHSRKRTDPDNVIGAKPSRFAYWVFDLLGAQTGDTLDDLYPGSGGIRRAWEASLDRSVASAGEVDGSPRGRVDGSPRGRVDGSPRGRVDGSPRGRVDGTREQDELAEASPRARDDLSTPPGSDASPEVLVDGDRPASEIDRVLARFGLGSRSRA